jgi:hypothetical protein
MLSLKDRNRINADPKRSDSAKKGAANREHYLRIRQRLNRAFEKKFERWPDSNTELNKFAVESGQYEELQKSGSKYWPKPETDVPSRVLRSVGS